METLVVWDSRHTGQQPTVSESSCSAGAAILRDNRLWHGGTPNLSDRMRALPNMEYFPPGALPSLGWLDRHTMPWQIWKDLSPLAQYISRYVVAPPEESIPGVNEYSPAAILEIMPFLR